MSLLHYIYRLFVKGELRFNFSINNKFISFTCGRPSTKDRKDSSLSNITDIVLSSSSASTRKNKNWGNKNKQSS